MNFFEHQAQARKNTGVLVALFALAVASLIMLTNIAVAIAVLAFSSQTGEPSPSLQSIIALPIFTYTSVGVVSVVLLASLYKLIQFSSGGRAVAEAMGGQLIVGNTSDADEKKALNVVEEMAIAAGVPVPPVYLIDDDAINAFAAGYKPQDAAIGLTKGCVQALSRDELQGVIAHEFSHILHGDMRLNIRLIGILHGILIIGIIGYYLLRSVSRSGYRSRSGKNNSAAAILALGGALMVIGYAGTFFGNLIKAAVSRQREFLADASAVQFTRNPLGIGGALRKIGGYSAGTQLDHPGTAEFSHMFFGQAVKTAFTSLMATHPPLDERIKRVDPSWDGRYLDADIGVSVPDSEISGQAAAFAGGASSSAQAQIAGASQGTMLGSVGNPSPAHLDYSQALLDRVPQPLRETARDPFGARALVYCLLLDARPNCRALQWGFLQESADPAVMALVEKIYSGIVEDPVYRLPLLELCMPALKTLTKDQYALFKTNITGLIKADDKVALFEWALYRILIHNLEKQPVKLNRLGEVGKIKDVSRACALVLSAVAHAGASTEPQAQKSFDAAKLALGLPSLEMRANNKIQLQSLSQALAVLNRLKPLLKPRLLKALCLCIMHDEKVKPVEAELLRAISDALDCPMPPLLSEQRLF